MKKLILLAISAVICFGILLAMNGCDTDAQVASYNLSKDADMFRINRRIVFYNGITGDYMLVIEGMCSINADRTDNQLEVTCKVGEDKYKKHFLGLADNIAYMAEQLEPSEQSVNHYKVIFKPATIIPDVEVRF